MPTVPQYGGPQVREQPAGPQYLNEQQFTGGARNLAAAGQALGVGAELADRVVQREAQRTAYDAQTKIQGAYLDWQQQVMTQRQGEKAKGTVNDTDAWWTKQAEAYGQSLDPMARQLVGRQIQQLRLQSMETMGRFENVQLEKATDDAWSGAKTMIKSSAAANPFVSTIGPDGLPRSGVESALADLRAKNAEFAARKGNLSPEVLAAMNLKDSTELHTQVLQGLERVAPDQAATYFAKYKDQINGEVHAELQAGIAKQGMLAQAQTIAADVAGRFNYLQTADAQKAIDGMSVAPEVKKAAMEDVKQRHAAQQSDADKSNAVLMGKLHTMVEQGASAASIQRTPEFAQVRDQGQVLQLIRERQEHQVQMQNAAESRDWAKVQRLRAEQEFQGTVRMYPFTDPTVLAGMSRPQVAAKVLELGVKNTEELLKRYDSLKNDEAKLREAKMDHATFQTIAADIFGADKVFKPNDEMKATLARAKSRVDSALTEWRVQNPKADPDQIRDKASGIMRGMLAEEVITRGAFGMTWGPFGTRTNALAVSDKDAAKIAVPATDVQQITEALRRSKGPQYQPTPEELGRLYLTKKQRDAANR